MQHQDIPASQWADLLNQFSRRHHGQDVHVEILGPEIGLQRQADAIPLLGVMLELSAGAGAGAGGGAGAGQKIDVVAGAPGRALVSHTIDHPSRVRLCEWNDGVSAELEIEARDGSLTRVRVGPPEQTLPPGGITDGVYERY